MKKNKKDIAIIGPYPPPLGGISVHIQRMEYFLRREGIDYTIFDHGFNQNEHVIPTKKSYLWYIIFLFNRSFKVVHFHHFTKFHYFYYFLFSLINKTPFIITIHNQNLIKFHPVLKRIFLYLLKLTKRKQVISVSKKVSDLLSNHNISNYYIPAYVPPVNINQKEIDLPSNKKIILFSSYRVNKYLAENVYNYPEIFRFINENKKNFHLLLMIGDKKSSDLSYLKTLIRTYKIEKNITLIYDKQLVDYMQNADVLIRPTLVDGYGVSLQEALDLGVPAIASDVCKRPQGTVIFENDNYEDMERKIKETLSLPKSERIKNKENTDYHIKLLKLYKELLGI